MGTPAQSGPDVPGRRPRLAGRPREVQTRCLPVLSGVPLGSQRGGPLEALQGGLASPLPVRSPDAHPPPWENGLRGLRGGTPPPSGPRAYTGPRLTLGWGLAPLQSPPSQQGADRTLTLRPGPGPGPLHISIRLLAFLLGSCQPGRRAAGVCGRGGGGARAPQLRSPGFLLTLPRGGGRQHTKYLSRTCSVSTPSTPPGRSLDVTPQRPSPKENDTQPATAGGGGQTGSLGGLLALL